MVGTKVPKASHSPHFTGFRGQLMTSSLLQQGPTQLPTVVNSQLHSGTSSALLFIIALIQQHSGALQQH